MASCIKGVCFYSGCGGRGSCSAIYACETSSNDSKVREAVIFEVKNFEETKALIINFVKAIDLQEIEAEGKAKPMKDINQQILTEMRKMRMILEK